MLFLQSSLKALWIVCYFLLVCVWDAQIINCICYKIKPRMRRIDTTWSRPSENRSCVSLPTLWFSTFSAYLPVSDNTQHTHNCEEQITWTRNGLFFPMKDISHFVHVKINKQNVSKSNRPVYFVSFSCVSLSQRVMG